MYYWLSGGITREMIHNSFSVFHL